MRLLRSGTVALTARYTATSRTITEEILTHHISTLKVSLCQVQAVEVLAELGVPDEDIDALLSAKVARQLED